jgi:hypothetical protein
MGEVDRHREVYLDQNHRTGRPWGPSNLAGRLASQILPPELGQPVLVEHRPGRGWAEPVPGLIVGLQSLSCPIVGATTLLIRVVPPERGSP